MLLCKGAESSNNSGVLCQMGKMFWNSGCPAGSQGHFLPKNGICRKIQRNSLALTWLAARAHDFHWYGQCLEIYTAIRFKPTGVFSICRHSCPGIMGIWTWHCIILKLNKEMWVWQLENFVSQLCPQKYWPLSPFWLFCYIQAKWGEKWSLFVQYPFLCFTWSLDGVFPCSQDRQRWGIREPLQNLAGQVKLSM